MFPFTVAAAVFAIPILITTSYMIGLSCCNDWSSKTRRSLSNDFDHDADGTDMKTFISALSDGFPRFFIVFGALFGLLISVFHALGNVFEVRHLESNKDISVAKWILVIEWIMILVQVVLMIRSTCTIKRFNTGLGIAISTFSLVLCLTFDIYWLGVHKRVDGKDISFIAGQLMSGMKILWAAVSLPRRPEVYSQGHVVDAQYTTSARNRYTFAWVRPLLDLAQKGSSIEISDLPQLDNSTRTKALQKKFNDTTHQLGNRKMPLWYIIYQVHKDLFIRQWTVAVLETFAMMCPQICFYKILTLLEARDVLGGDNLKLWFWIGALGVSKMVHLFLETWLEWIKFGLLATPVRSQLTSLIFYKSMHLKDIKEIENTKPKKVERQMKTSREELRDEENTYELEDAFPNPNEDQTPLMDMHDEEDTPSKREEQRAFGVVNLVGVDVQRLSMFCGENVLLMASFLKIILGTWFLVYLIGWRSTFAGLAVPVLLQPLSRVVSKNYNGAQLAVMAARDEKTHIVTEAIYGIRQIKFSALEEKWQRAIMETRGRELKAQWHAYTWLILLTICWLCMPILLGAVGLGVYAWLSRTMTASVAFTSLSVFSTLEFTLSAVPINISKLLDARISSERIQQHLYYPDKKNNSYTGDSITFENATIAWPARVERYEAFTLKGVTLQFPDQQLSIIHGKTGSGKSLLLAAIIKEADLLQGKINSPNPSPNDPRLYPATEEHWIIPTAMAYVAQIPWIENATIKSNILYSAPFNSARYAAVLYASALDQDLAILPDGDETEVGATGINLSGGQKQRLTLARALYSRAGILVLDDIFSAVDAHVGRHILKHGLKGELGIGRTIILATHHVRLVQPVANYIVEIEDGGLIQASRCQPLDINEVHAMPEHRLSFLALSDSESLDELVLDELQATSLVQQPKKFVVEETREHGHVKWEVYKTYVNSSGGWVHWGIALATFALSALLLFARSYWIKTWTETSEVLAAHSIPTHNNTTGIANAEATGTTTHVVYYLCIYLAISFLSIVFIAIKITMILLAALRASKRLFEDLTYRILRARLRWLDTMPVGRVLNRFIGDFALIDSQLGMDLMLFLNRIFGMGTIAIAALLLSAWTLFPVVFFGLVCIYYTSVYLVGARDIRRLESVTRSPVFDLFESALSGLSTIRTFGRVDDYVDRMSILIDEYGRSSWYIILANRWVAFRQGFLGTIFALCLAASVIILPNIDVGLAGFALSFGMDFSRVVVITIAQYAGFELDMNSTERVIEFVTKPPIEDSSGHEIPAQWPSKGRVVFSNLETGYADNLPPVLKGVNFTIESRQRVGVVGRTGSGKTSLTLALFRFLEPRKGYISVDGLDISKIKLRDLRSRLAIIPQDPVLFSGSLRSNLDPFNEYGDSELWDALRRVYLVCQDETERSNALNSPNRILGHDNVNIFSNLDSTISRGGLNLSAGQRQLLCLARAILARPKLLVLDEATSAVDIATDKLIQRSIRDNFQNSTLIVIAHRLSTIADFDKILVLNDGRVDEFDDPKELIRRRGAYWRMLNESGDK